jgi:preprotein translocase subunit YajC
MTKSSRIKLVPVLLLGGLAVFALARPATAQQVSREQDIVNLRLGQRIRVDDGTCPAGQVKEVSGAKMAATGIVRTHKCIPRVAGKTRPENTRQQVPANN